MNDELRQAVSSAIACEANTGVPAELLVAQFGLESGWGKHMPGNNCFGIKEYAGAFGRQLLQTHEWFTEAELARFLAGDAARTAEPTGQSNVLRKEYAVRDWFATFRSLAACFDRRAQLFLAGRYKPFADQYLKDGDAETLIRGIAPIYATAPGYADTLLQLVSQKNIQTVLAQLRGSNEADA